MAARITPHQRDTRERLARAYRHGIHGVRFDGELWVRVTRTGSEGFGSVGAVAHLARKGAVETTTIYGERGGEIILARPLAATRRVLDEQREAAR